MQEEECNFNHLCFRFKHLDNMKSFYILCGKHKQLCFYLETRRYQSYLETYFEIVPMVIDTLLKMCITYACVTKLQLFHFVGMRKLSEVSEPQAGQGENTIILKR